MKIVNTIFENQYTQTKSLTTIITEMGSIKEYCITKAIVWRQVRSKYIIMILICPALYK